MASRVLLALVIAAFATSPRAAEPPKQPTIVASVSSPGNVLKVEIGLDEERASYSVSRLGVPLIRASRLGFRLRDREKFDRHLALASQSSSSFDQTWEQPWGENRLVRNHYNELRVRFTEKIRLKRSLDLVFRVFDDGVGFRYEFPDQAQLHDVIIQDELTEFDVPTADSGPYRITVGPDKALWFTEILAGKIGRITTDGKITEYAIPTAKSGPRGITTGPDGALWFTEGEARKIGRISPDGGEISEIAVPVSPDELRPQSYGLLPSDPAGYLQGIVLGPDGNLWFTDSATQKVMRVTFGGPRGVVGDDE